MAMPTASTAMIDATTRFQVICRTPDALMPRRSTSSEPVVCPATTPTENTATPTRGTVIACVMRNRPPKTPPVSVASGSEPSRIPARTSPRPRRVGRCTTTMTARTASPVTMVHQAG